MGTRGAATARSRARIGRAFGCASPFQLGDYSERSLPALRLRTEGSPGDWPFMDNQAEPRVRIHSAPHPSPRC